MPCVTILAVVCNQSKILLLKPLIVVLDNDTGRFETRVMQ